MTNQALDFLDIDLGLYVNNFDSSSSSSSSVNAYSSNPNLSNLYDKETPNLKPSIIPPPTTPTTNIANQSDLGLKQSKSPTIFPSQVQRTHSYSFSSPSSSWSFNLPTLNSNQINQLNIASHNKSTSQLSTFTKSKSEITTKKALLKCLEKRTSRKSDSVKHIKADSKLNNQTFYTQNIQNNSGGHQLLSNSYSSISSSDQVGNIVNTNNRSYSSSINISPSSNSSICSSSSSSNFDFNSMKNYSDLTFKSQLPQASLNLNSSFFVNKIESDDKIIKKQHSNIENNIQSGMDLLTTITSTHYDDSNNLTTPTESINQIDYVNTIIPVVSTHTQKKQPLLLPKPAPSSHNNNNNNNTQFAYTNPTALVIPPINQSPFITNSQISMMIPNITNGVISRSNSQPDLSITNLDPNFMNDMIMSNYSAYNSICNSSLNSTSTLNCSDSKIRSKVFRRHPSLSYKSSDMNESDEGFMSGFLTNINMENTNTNTNSSINNKMSSNTLVSNSINQACNNNTDDGLFLGIDALSDFISNCGNITDLFEDLPDLEDLMSLVTFESSSSSSANALSSSVPASSLNYLQHTRQQTNCDLNLPNRLITNTINNLNDCINTNPLSNYYDYCNTELSIINQNESNQDNDDTAERTTRSAPPSPTPQKKKQRPTSNNIAFNKAWTKMNVDEQSDAVKALVRIINDEMGLREQLEIIRILNPDVKFKQSDTQCKIDIKSIDDDKFRRIKEVIKTYGLYLNDKLISDNASDCSANSCPQSYQLAKRELRIKRAHQRLKLKQKKDQRQITKESKSGLFIKTEVIPLSQILPEEDIEVDILS